MKKLALIACSTAICLLPLTDIATAGGGKKFKTIEGAWEVQAVARWETEDCTSGEIVPFGPNPFRILQTFNKGGTMNDYAARTGPAERSTGFGTWEKSGKRTFTSHTMALGFDTNGLLSTNIDGRSDITLSDDGYSYSGISRIKLEDLSGNAVTICLTLEGARVPL